MSRRQALVAVQFAFAVLAVIAGIALTFALGPVSDAINQTTARVVGAALLALAVGALAAARDPAGNRAMVRVEIVFTVLCALDLAHKLAIDEGGRVIVWLLLASLIVGAIALAVLYPAAGEAPARRTDGEAPARRAADEAPARRAADEAPARRAAGRQPDDWVSGEPPGDRASHG